MANPKDILRRQLISATQKGGITLVLGAGVSIPRGIPNWNDLAKSVWKDVLKGKPSPWARQSKGSSPKEVPQFLPMVFEHVYRELRDDARFLEVLKKHLYAKARFPLKDPSFLRSKEALAVLASLIVAEHKRGPGRRIQAIITFNADDFIEQQYLAPPEHEIHTCRPKSPEQWLAQPTDYCQERRCPSIMCTDSCRPIFGAVTVALKVCWFLPIRNIGQHRPALSRLPTGS